MLNPLTWSRRSNDDAVRNARLAATELSRLRVDREEIEQYVARRAERRTAQHATA